jgi:predicted RNase H-like HicB family nuclease
MMENAMVTELTAVIERHGRWYVAYIPEIPGVNTQGRTLKETRENLRDALELILACNRDTAEPIGGGDDVIREPFAEITYRQQ